MSEKYDQMISNLKLKLISSARDHETEVAAFREEIGMLEEKANAVEHLEEMLEIYRNRYEEAVSSLDKISIWEKEKAKLNKIIQDKDTSIHKLQEKIEELTEKLIDLEEKQIYWKMDLEKKERKFKEIEKELKNKVNQSSRNNINSSLYLSQMDKENISRMYVEDQNPNEKSQEINELK
jgi:septal ring factor EnvC (AmiA/AmiB activator)